MSQTTETQKGAMYYGPHDLRIEQIPVKAPMAGQVKIKIAWCGICGSDLHEYESGPILCPTKDTPHKITGEKLPICMGHEFSGTVCEVGPDTKGDWKVGDRVVVEPVISCRNCYACSKDYNNVQYGAMVEPLAVAIHAVEQSGMKKGDTALVLGAGPIGCFVIKTLIAQGASQVIVSEPSATRRSMASKAGAHHVLNPRDGDIVDEVRRLTGGPDLGVDVSFECAGVQVTLTAALASLRPRGTCVNVAIWSTKPQIDMNVLVLGEKTLRGVVCYRNNHKTAIDSLASGAITLEGFVTATIKLDDLVEQGFKQLIHNAENHVKILVSPTGREE